MVKVDYLGRLGNNMFQYALGRYLAEEMGYELGAYPLPFAATKEKVDGNVFSEAIQQIGLFHIDVPAVIGNHTNRMVLLHGFFQNYKYYEPFMDRIRKWYEYSGFDHTLPEIRKDDVLIYVRLGDYADQNMHLAFPFYETAIKMSAPGRTFISTDSKDHPFLRNFIPYNPIFLSGDSLLDLVTARLFKKIVLSCSTFSWWAAVLGRPEQVYFPIADKGLWSPDTMYAANGSRVQQDLRIDEPNYVYFYNCAIVSSERKDAGLIPLSEAHPEHFYLQKFSQHALQFHQKTKAYWFI